MRNTKNLLRSTLLFALCIGGALGASSCSSKSVVKGLDDGILTVGLECNYKPFNWTTSTS